MCRAFWFWSPWPLAPAPTRKIWNLLSSTSGSVLTTLNFVNWIINYIDCIIVLTAIGHRGTAVSMELVSMALVTMAWVSALPPILWPTTTAFILTATWPDTTVIPSSPPPLLRRRRLRRRNPSTSGQPMKSKTRSLPISTTAPMAIIPPGTPALTMALPLPPSRWVFTFQSECFKCGAIYLFIFLFFVRIQTIGAYPYYNNYAYNTGYYHHGYAY